MIQIPKIPEPNNFKISTLEILQYIVLISLIFYFGKTLLIPLSFSLLISFILYPVCIWMEKKGVSKIIAIFISLSVIILLVTGILYLLILQFNEFSQEWEPFKKKLLESLDDLSLYIVNEFEISPEKQSEFLTNLFNNSGTEAFSLLRNLIYSLTESFFYIIIIPVFSALILYHRQLLANALYQIFPADRKQTIHEILIETINAYYNFVKGMLLVYLIVGLLNSIGLTILGIPHAFVFGFIASILTFIPYIGIMISSLLPITVSWITFNSIWYPLGVILVFSIVQILEAYIIFPLAVGTRLKINTLIIIIMITLGGILWGAAGMILFIPLISIIKLIADRTESLKTLSILLGDGNIKKKKP